MSYCGTFMDLPKTLERSLIRHFKRNTLKSMEFYVKNDKLYIKSIVFENAEEDELDE